MNQDTDYYLLLHTAAAAGDVDSLRSCLEMGVPVNHVAGRNSKSALYRAVKGQHEEAVRVLLAAGANPDDKHGLILHEAVQGESQDIVRILLEAGADVNFREPMFGDTPLLWSISFADTPMVKLLLEHGADPNARSGYFGAFYALHSAAEAGLVDIVQLLLAAGANVNCYTDEGTWSTPLHICTHGVVPLLLAAGANPEAAGPEGVTPLHAAAYRGQTGIAQALLEAGVQVDARLRATEESHLRGDEMMFRLPTGDESAFYCDEFVPIGSTPLHLAALQGELPLIELLLAHGADPLARTQAGTTAQELIWKARQAATTKLLPQPNTPTA